MLFVSALPASSLIGIGKELVRLRQKTTIDEVTVIRRLEAASPDGGEFLFTNQPAVAFHSGWCLPPRLGVLSLKRFWSGAIDHEQMIEELKGVNLSYVYFGGEMRKVNPSVLKYAEEALGRSEQIGAGILFSKNSENRSLAGVAP